MASARSWPSQFLWSWQEGSSPTALAVVLLLVGIGMLSEVTAKLAAYFVESDTDDTVERLDRIERLLEQLAEEHSSTIR